MREKNTPNDPERRERIVSATIELLRDGGVVAVTARAVASRAGVPLGSVSYHFASVRALLIEASRRVVHLRIAALTEWGRGVTAETVVPRLAELIHQQLTVGRALTVVSYELYLLGLRDAEFREISAGSVRELRAHLRRYCAPGHVERLAATADGFQLESLFDPTPPDIDAIATVLANTN